MTDRSLRADQLAHARRTNPQTDDDLRTRIAEVLNATPAQFIQDDPDEGEWFKDRPYRRHDQHRYDGGCAMCRGETDTLVQAVLAVVQPELDRLAAERDAEAQRADAEGLTGAGIFSEYYDRWQGTIAEARRQAARVDEVAARGTAAVVAMGRDVRQARGERDRYRLAWQSARRRATNHQATVHTFADGGVDDIAELYRAQAAIQTAGGKLTKPVHQAIDAIRAKWDRVLRSEQQKRADAEATVARVTALAADMRTWCSPHGLADHYADQLDRAIAGPESTPEETRS